MFDIRQLQNHVSPEIYMRGKAYYQQQQVADLYHKGEGKWQALVLGTDDYAVHIQLSGNDLQKATCTCPHDADICKHIVAALLALQQEEALEEENKPAAGATAAKKGRAKKEGPDIKTALHQLSKEELLSLVLSYAAQSREFKSFLTIHLLTQKGGAGKEGYRQAIQAAIKPYMRRGFIEYADSHKAMKPLLALAGEAENNLAKGFFREAADGAMALIEEIAGIIDCMDDSAGYTTNISSAAFDVLYGVVTSEAPFALKEALFEQALQERKKKKYRGWDWPDDFFELAIAAASEEKQYRQLLTEVDTELGKASAVRHGWMGQYTRQNLLHWKCTVLQKMGRPEEARAMLLQHLDIPDFRRQVVADHLRQGNITEAAMLCEEALQQNIGQQTLWCEWLLQIAQQRKDVEGIRKWSLNLFLETQYSLPYFRMYRSAFPAGEWPPQRQRLLAMVQKSAGPWSFASGLAPLYVEEQLWPELLHLCEAAANIDFLLQYDQHLWPLYPAALLALYKKVLLEYAAAQQGRAHYVRIRKVLVALQKQAGGNALVKDLVQTFRQQYKLRRTMMEELDKLVL
ncbi:SWIM zinc finger family protein [Pseudocnuella soli]|uniref:SWIM zinc finger family protein n=1 Tax=Pseudocnuella soli TaxID=2502779 RepID=UPI00104F2AA3|nr:SWIM zinc finger family protein [Pseudocnuella soli]